MNSSFGRNNAMQGDVDARASARGGLNAAGGSNDRSSFGGRGGEQANISIKVNGETRTFAVMPAALKALKEHADQKNLIFFTTNGRDVTAISALGEQMNMRVVSRSGNTFTLQSADGQSRLITLDAKTAARLHVKVGATLQLTALSADRGRVVALDFVKAHQFDKFSPSGRSTAAARQAQQLARMNAAGRTPPGLPHQCVNPAGNTRGFCKSAANGGSVAASASANGSAKRNARDRQNNEVADNAPNGDRGKCGPGKSRNGNPAYANQMAKDAANDASGHNPPGLPHECVNPAGHTRGFCKSSSSEALCGSGGASGGGVTPSDLHGGIAGRVSAPAPGTGVAPGTALAPGSGNGEGRNNAVASRGFTPSGGGDRGPGSPVGVIPVASGTYPSATRGSTRGSAPTHVLGASARPANGRRIAALPTRVLPVAIQPVGKKRCVWYKTGVLAASSGPYRIIGTSANGGKPTLHKKCR